MPRKCVSELEICSERQGTSDNGVLNKITSCRSLTDVRNKIKSTKVKAWLWMSLFNHDVTNEFRLDICVSRGGKHVSWPATAYGLVGSYQHFGRSCPSTFQFRLASDGHFLWTLIHAFVRVSRVARGLLYSNPKKRDSRPVTQTADTRAKKKMILLIYYLDQICNCLSNESRWLWNAKESFNLSS